MSLINDALKRAKQAQSRPSPAPLSDAPLQPALAASHASERFARLIPAAGALTLLLACWFLWLWWRTASPVAQAGPVPHATNRLVAALRTASAVASTVASNRTELALAGLSARPGPAPARASSNTMASLPPARSLTAASNSLNKPLAADAKMPLRPSAIAEPSKPNDVFFPTLANDPALAGFKLQGIFYRAANASVLINGHTLFVGDEIDGAKLVGIERHLARLLIGGRTNVVRLR